MKRNFDEQILDLNREPIRMGATAEAITKAINVILSKLSPELQQEFTLALEKETGKPITLGLVCVAVLMGAYPDEAALSLLERTKRMKLALRIVDGGVQEITPEDRDLIKSLLIKGFTGVLVPVTAAELLEKDMPTADLKVVS